MNKASRWLRLAVGVLTLFFVGIIYAWSILKAPMASEFGWSNQLSLNFTVMMCCFCLGGLVSGLLGKKLSPFIRMAASALLVFLGFYLCSRLDGKSALALYASYGLLAGTGIGVVYNVVIAATNAWFPDKKGISSGCLMMGFGFSTLVLGKAADALIKAPAVGWRMAYVILGAAIGAVVLLAAFVVRPPRQGELAGAAAPGAAQGGGEDFSAVQMLRTAAFWKLFVFFVLLAAVGSTAISFARDFSLSVGASESFAVTLVGLLSICNGLGRLFSGWVFDSRGLRATQIATSAVAVAAPLMALAALLTGRLWLGAAGLCLCGFSYGFSPTASAAFTAAFFGQKNFALNFSILNLVLIPSSFAATLAGLLVARYGSYVPAFVMLAAFSVLGMAVNFTIRRPSAAKD